MSLEERGFERAWAKQLKKWEEQDCDGQTSLLSDDEQEDE